MPDDTLLRTSLLDLAKELQEREISWILGGGYGLFLKQLHLQERSVRTLIPLDIWPEPRGTNDLDVFLTVEVVPNLARMQAMRQVLDNLGYLPRDEVKYMQFVRQLGGGRKVKVDLLVGPEILEADRAGLDIKKPRVRAKGDLKLHARITEDAVAIEEGLVEVPVAGPLSTGEPFEATVLVPQGFTYLVMKLCAFRDQEGEHNRPDASNHALDLYRTVAMLTEREYEQAKVMADRFREDVMYQQAKGVVAEHFQSLESIGVIRLREHPLFTDTAAEGLEDFLSVLKELFPPCDVEGC